MERSERAPRYTLPRTEDQRGTENINGM